MKLLLCENVSYRNRDSEILIKETTVFICLNISQTFKLINETILITLANIIHFILDV